MGLDLVSITGHKVHGPKGVGAIYIREKYQKEMDVMIYGGGQEMGIRSGTLAPAQVIGLVEAIELADKLQIADRIHMTLL